MLSQTLRRLVRMTPLLLAGVALTPAAFAIELAPAGASPAVVELADPATVSRLQHPDWRVRTAAALELGSRVAPEILAEARALQPLTTRAGFPRLVGDGLTLPFVGEVLLDRYVSGQEEAGVRRALIEALPRTSGDWAQAVAELLPAEPDVEVRVVMASVLRRADPAAAEVGLASALRDPRSEVRAEALRSVSFRPDGAGWSAAVVGGLGDASAEVRAAAARAAGYLGVTGAVPVLLPLLRDADADVQLDALNALGRLAPEQLRGHPDVLSLVDAADPRLRRAAERLR